MSLPEENMHIKFEILEHITNKFAEEQEIGRGAYGKVYLAVYNGQEVAVKRLDPQQGLDDKAFDNELRNLMKINHPNIVQLIGFCREERRQFVPHNGNLITAVQMERILCFEYVEGGSLRNHISDEYCDLDWPTCYKIIKGTCEGLNHLHSSQEKPIYHLDLKPANILLDKNMTAKVGDLGLSRLVSSTITQITESYNGTYVFMPPEYKNGGGAISKKFDVFSFGVTIINIMDGNNGTTSRYYEMPAEHYINHLTRKWNTKLQATSTYSSPEINTLQFKTCIKMALKCADIDRKKRPHVKDIVKELEELEDKIKNMSL